VNLLLSVSPQIVAGKHQLNSIFCSISLADCLLLSFEPAVQPSVSLSVSYEPGLAPLDVLPAENICSRAVAAFEQQCGLLSPAALAIQLHKRLPAQAGLGGGSSDAAAVLRVLALRAGIASDDQRLQAAAASLGADVAFFLRGGCAWMAGDGSLFRRELPNPQLHLVLVKPAGGISSKSAYAAFDASPQPEIDLAGLTDLMHLAESAEPAARSDSPGCSLPVGNNLYPAALSLLPELGPLMEDLGAQPGIEQVLLSGSGSTVFGICSSGADARQAAARLGACGLWAQAVSTRSDAGLLEELLSGGAGRDGVTGLNQ
jgi:4-diphosphocytidyl-2-C-methyl-D-erythritol kinase